MASVSRYVSGRIFDENKGMYVSATKISPTRPKGIVLKKDVKLSPDTKESITKQSGTSTDR